MKDIKQIADEHATWYSENLSYIIKKVYHDAFLHGFKHGKEAKEQ